MRRLLVIFTAVIFVASAASLAFAEVQNIKVSGDIGINAISRDGFDLGTDSALQSSSTIMSTTRVRIDADLTDNVSATVRLLNERDWNVEAADGAADNSDMDLDLAYVTLKEMLYSPLTLTLGRQELRFGNGLIVGDPDTNALSVSAIQAEDLSARKAFDAIRATLDYDPLTVDVIYSKITENGTLIGDEERDDTDLFGVNAAYDLGDNYGTVLEGYLFVRRDESTNAGAALANASARTDTIYCPGLRISTNPIERLNVQAEAAVQVGKVVTDTTGADADREARAAQVIANYALDMDMSPVLGASYTWLSGDDTSTSNNEGWNQMFEDQTAGHIINTIFTATNTHLINLKGSLKPADDLTIALDYVTLWLDESNVYVGATTLPLATGTKYAGAATATGEKHLGQEIDLGLTYDYTEDVQLGLLCGYFYPGDAFDGANSENATEVIASCKVSF